MDMSEILDFLYLGAKTVSEDGDALRDLGIGFIINCTTGNPNLFADLGVAYYRVDVDDKPDALLYSHFASSGRFIEDARRQGSKVLCHCTMGMSRSSTIVIAYLMEHRRMRLADAIRLTKEKRAVVSPNWGFMKQLLQFEQALFGSQSVDLERYKKSRFEPVDAFEIRAAAQ